MASTAGDGLLISCHNVASCPDLSIGETMDPGTIAYLKN